MLHTFFFIRQWEQGYNEITMKTVFLTGSPGTGKTTTLKSVYSLLKESGATDILLPVSCPSSPSDFEYFISWRGLKIGIVTLGDYSKDIIWYLGVYHGRNADVLIIANSNKATPYSIIEGYGIESVEFEKKDIWETGVADRIINAI